jgi:hypothetical protein
MMIKKLRDLATGWSDSSSDLLKKLSLFLHKLLVINIAQISGHNRRPHAAVKTAETTWPNGFEDTTREITMKLIRRVATASEANGIVIRFTSAFEKRDNFLSPRVAHKSGESEIDQLTQKRSFSRTMELEQSQEPGSKNDCLHQSGPPFSQTFSRSRKSSTGLKGEHARVSDIAGSR